LILKLITPPPTKADDEGHTRKILSYQVEQYFYANLAPHLPKTIPVAKCIASINEHHADGTSTTAMIMTDLQQHYPIAGEKRSALSPTQVNAAIDWLASFHGFWWPRVHRVKGDKRRFEQDKNFDRIALVKPPLEEIRSHGDDAEGRTVWLNGGYTYLATRRKEFTDLHEDEESEWNEPLTDNPDSEEGDVTFAEMVAAVLAPRVEGWGPSEEYQTLIHGDVKSENLFASRDGNEVAFYDFQYVGLGLGVCDLAKLFTCSVPLSELVTEGHLDRELRMQDQEERLLHRYWTKLREVSGKEYDWGVFVRHWETALVDWLRFQASWGFWGNTEWLEARVRSILKDEGWKKGILGNWKPEQ
jgi:hypothetical protein